MAYIDGKTAKRYAKALFDSVDQGALEGLQEALFSFAETWDNSSELHDVMFNPAVSEDEKLSVIRDLSALVKSGDEKFSNFLCLLQANNRLAGISVIAEEFAAMIAELKNLLSVEVTSAFPVPEEERGAVLDQIQKEHGSLATITWSEDKNILGGLRIQAGDRLLDSSVQGQLLKLKSSLGR